MSKKYRKLMPEACQNDTKMDAKIDEISYFSKKDEKMFETVCFTIEKVVLGT